MLWAQMAKSSSRAQASRQPLKAQDQQHRIDRGPAGQAEPHADRAEVGAESEYAGGGESDQPVANRSEQQWDAGVVEAAQRAGRDGLDAVGDEERGADQQQ